ncbi:DUF2752 domain-containing protein [Nocardiopsis tropica]|uniref:DUF2752 domain-containing protein n=1 Tax=Nocardiopsis tropica TaxID=109330 RepID=A0ABU7KK63_9ACTN|nr:DUF2752 domain-containing protein [Nocardiopsis umidischolae]MEE2049666.1 DUF2752 domain-containing protein [Nocardiopsis umidischolae]
MPPETRALRTPLIWFWCEGTDRLRAVTATAVAGLAIGAALAIFGLPPVDTHGPQHSLGFMAPTCGGTRALRFTMLGRLDTAFAYNPLSPILVLGAVSVLLRHVAGAVTGRWLSLYFPRKRLVSVVAILFLGALWVNQQAHADLLMGP